MAIVFRLQHRLQCSLVIARGPAERIGNKPMVVPPRFDSMSLIVRFVLCK